MLRLRHTFVRELRSNVDSYDYNTLRDCVNQNQGLFFVQWRYLEEEANFGQKLALVLVKIAEDCPYPADKSGEMLLLLRNLQTGYAARGEDAADALFSFLQNALNDFIVILRGMPKFWQKMSSL